LFLVQSRNRFEKSIMMDEHGHEHGIVHPHPQRLIDVKSVRERKLKGQ